MITLFRIIKLHFSLNNKIRIDDIVVASKTLLNLVSLQQQTPLVP